MDNTFLPDEKLYRRVVNQPNFWNEDGTLSTAAFKDTHGGVSVDRANKRTTVECVNTITEKAPNRSIVSVKVSNCTECESVVKYKPITDVSDPNYNMYHSEIHRTDDVYKLTKAQLRHLATTAVVEKKL